MVTKGPKKGGGKGKSQLTLYINSRPPNGECETAHEVSLEGEERGSLQSLQANWRSGENLIGAAGRGTDAVGALGSCNVEMELKIVGSDGSAV